MIVARTIFHGVKAHLAYRFSEWVNAALLGVITSILLGPAQTFQSSHSYDFMAAFMSETHWGMCLGLVVSGRLLALGINGSFRWFKPYSPAVRAVTAWFSAAAWCALALGFYASNPAGTTWGMFTVLLVADVSLALRIAGEAGPAFRRHLNGRA